MKIGSNRWYTELAGDIDADLLTIAGSLEETYIGKYEGTMIGAATAVAILETILIRWREQVDESCMGDEKKLILFEDTVAYMREDLLSRVFIARGPRPDAS